VLQGTTAYDSGHQAWIRFLRAHASLTRRMSARLERDHGLTLNDYDVLVQLAGADGQRLRRVDLARSVLLSPSGITRLLDGLERAGWVEKGLCPGDARVTYAVLTDTGRAKFKEAQSSHLADVEAEFGSRFSAEERGALSGMLAQLLEPDDDDLSTCTGAPG
jgi:DNA-binding MarR family transcriptional regulator